MYPPSEMHGDTRVRNQEQSMESNEQSVKGYEYILNNEQILKREPFSRNEQFLKHEQPFKHEKDLKNSNKHYIKNAQQNTSGNCQQNVKSNLQNIKHDGQLVHIQEQFMGAQPKKFLTVTHEWNIKIMSTNSDNLTSRPTNDDGIMIQEIDSRNGVDNMDGSDLKSGYTGSQSDHFHVHQDSYSYASGVEIYNSNQNEFHQQNTFRDKGHSSHPIQNTSHCTNHKNSQSLSQNVYPNLQSKQQNMNSNPIQAQQTNTKLENVDEKHHIRGNEIYSITTTHISSSEGSVTATTTIANVENSSSFYLHPRRPNSAYSDHSNSTYTISSFFNKITVGDFNDQPFGTVTKSEHESDLTSVSTLCYRNDGSFLSEVGRIGKRQERRQMVWERMETREKKGNFLLRFFRSIFKRFRKKKNTDITAELIRIGR